MNSDSLGFFFDNFTRFQSLFPYLESCVREYKPQFFKMYDMLKNPDVWVYCTGTGRSGNVSQKIVENFTKGMNRRAYFVEKGTIPPARENDVLISISGRGDNPHVLQDAKVAKENKMKLISLTYDKNSELAKISDVFVKLPGPEKGEQQSKDFYHQLIGTSLPLMVMGSAFEFSSLCVIEVISYALQVQNKIPNSTSDSTSPEIFFKDVEELLYEISVYSGDVRRKLEDEKSQKTLNKVINSLGGEVRNIYTYGYGYTDHISTMFGTRLSHAIDRTARDVFAIDSSSEPENYQISKEDAIFAISGSGDTKYTCDIVERFLKKESNVFAITGKESSRIYKLVGEENCLLLPTSMEFSLLPNYSIRTFDSVVLIPLDCIAMEIMRRRNVGEEDAKASHSIFR